MVRASAEGSVRFAPSLNAESIDFTRSDGRVHRDHDGERNAMTRTTILAAIAASTTLTVAVCARADVHQSADELPISTHVCRGHVTQTSGDDEPTDAIKVGECYLYKTATEYKRVIAVCHIGDACQFRATIVGVAGWFVERIVGPVRRVSK
jgi:hypothetical protein